ncbi:MAG: alpha-L-arabinofuranosidase C-terminal domain-containing protein [Promethearchaeota archaeon]|jgi:alpha-N-arabinofuranosidase
MEKSNKIKINVDSSKKQINPMIYGNFIEHIGDCIHNGIWTYKPPNVPLVTGVPLLGEGVRKDLLEAIKEMRPTVLRAFGGCYSDVYHWKDAIGPRNERKVVKNLHWGVGGFGTIEGLGPDIKNQFGTDEFLTLCEIIGTKPYLNVNYGSGTPEEAADWVEYCNGSIDTEYGALRAKYGREKPYNVKVWGIANEIYAAWEKGYEKTPEDYAEKYLKFAKRMREKDPTIKLVAVGYDNSNWNQTVLKMIGKEWIDFLSIHRYLPNITGPSAGRKRRDNEKIYHALMASMPLIRDYINDTWNDIISVLGENTHVRIVFDEWGLWYLIKDVIRTNYNLQDGIWTALTLMTFQKMSYKCPIANWAQLVNCIGTIQTDPDGLILTPVYLAFKLFVDHMYNNLIEDVKVECKTFENRKYGSIPEYNNVPYIECNANINNEEDNLSLMIINKHFSENLKTTLEISGFTPYEKGTVIELTSTSPFDYNTLENRNNIQIKKKILKNVKTNMNLELQAHSVIVVKLTKST